METARRPELRRVVLALDALAIAGSMLLALGVHRALRDAVGFLKQPPRFEAYAALAYLILPLWLALVVAFGLDRTFERRWSWGRLLWDLARLHAVGLAGLALVGFLTQAVVNRSLVAMLLASTFLLMLATRVAIGAWLAYQHQGGQGRERWLLVGAPTPEMSRLIADARSRDYPPEVVGYLAGESPAAPAMTDPEAADLPRRLGGLDDLGRVLHEEAVDQVLFLPPYQRPEESAAALEACETLGVSAAFAVELARASVSRPRLVELYGRPFVTFETAPKRPEALAVKHGFDLVASVAGLLVTLPLLVAVALAVWITMGRPIFFLQERMGLAGRRFRMIKFRTMERGAEARRPELAAGNEMGGPVFKMTGDPRVTRLGRFLRRSSLDELPQLLNVASGAMSLVGPRPLPVGEQQQIHGAARRRLAMKPGITGLWQVSGRNDLPFEQWMELDLLYVDTWSLGLDGRILLRTLPALLSRRGAR